jgi:hypothetical protein
LFHVPVLALQLCKIGGDISCTTHGPGGGGGVEITEFLAPRNETAIGVCGVGFEHFLFVDEWVEVQTVGDKGGAH